MLIFLVTLALVLPAKIQALNIQLNDDGTVVVLPGNVLGDTTEQKEEEQKAEMLNRGSITETKPAEIRSTNMKPIELNKEELKKREEQKREMTLKNKKELEQANRVKRMIENKKSSVEVEVKNEGGDTINVKMREFERSKNAGENAKNLEEKKQERVKEMNEKKLDEEKNSLEKQKDRENELEIEREDEQEIEQENKQSNDVRKIKSTVEEKTDALNLKVGSTDIRSRDRGFEIEKGDVRAKTELPVSVQTDTRQLSVVTPLGTKTVTTLPDEAKNTVESSGFANQVVGDITLKQSGEDVVFHMNTVNDKRMFGLLPIKVNREVEVSATTGQITGTTQSFGQRLLDLFSF